MKKNLLLLMLALLLPAFMYGQEQTVSGTVLDTYNMGVPGASIVEKGTTNGTITDFDGNYTLTVSNKNATLVFSFIGYKTQEVPVAGKAKVSLNWITPYWKMQLWPMPDNLYKVRFPVYA